MSWPCPGCGVPRPSLFAAVLHCDPVEPIDELTDEPRPRSSRSLRTRAIAAAHRSAPTCTPRCRRTAHSRTAAVAEPATSPACSTRVRRSSISVTASGRCEARGRHGGRRDRDNRGLAVRRVGAHAHPTGQALRLRPAQPGLGSRCRDRLGGVMTAIRNPRDGQQVDVPDDVIDSYIAQGWQLPGAPKPKLDDLTIKQLRTLASQKGSTSTSRSASPRSSRRSRPPLIHERPARLDARMEPVPHGVLPDREVARRRPGHATPSEPLDLRHARQLRRSREQHARLPQPGLLLPG